MELPRFRGAVGVGQTGLLIPVSGFDSRRLQFPKANARHGAGRFAKRASDLLQGYHNVRRKAICGYAAEDWTPPLR